MALFTVEADGKPICTFAADDLNQAGQMAEIEKEEWAEIGAITDQAVLSVRSANISEAMVWKEIVAEAVADGAVEDVQEAEDSIVAFHVPLAGENGEDNDEDDEYEDEDDDLDDEDDEDEGR
jgi:hypothetical protein